MIVALMRSPTFLSIPHRRLVTMIPVCKRPASTTDSRRICRQRMNRINPRQYGLSSGCRPMARAVILFLTPLFRRLVLRRCNAPESCGSSAPDYRPLFKSAA